MNENDDLSRVLTADPMADAAEMLWVVLANVSGGDWTKQSADWQEAAARWRDHYFAALRIDATSATTGICAESETAVPSLQEPPREWDGNSCPDWDRQNVDAADAPPRSYLTLKEIQHRLGIGLVMARRVRAVLYPLLPQGPGAVSDADSAVDPIDPERGDR